MEGKPYLRVKAQHRVPADAETALGLRLRMPVRVRRANELNARSIEEARMTRVSLFNSPFLLGFDQLERTLDRVAKASGDGYPPYNIEQIGEDRLRITLAVAGFSMADLVVVVEGTQLVIRGKQQDDQERTFLHRGIATRQFQRSFVLAEGIEVEEAQLDNGLLNIDLKRPLPEVRQKVIDIKDSNGMAGRSAQTIDLSAKKEAS